MAKAFEFADFVDEFAVTFIVLDEIVNGRYNEQGKWIEGKDLQVDDKYYYKGDFSLGGIDDANETGVGFSETDGETERTMEGIILPLSNDELRYEQNGRYSALDRKVYTTQPLKMGQRIQYNGQLYTIDREKDYTAYADVYMYFAKGVGVEK